MSETARDSVSPKVAFTGTGLRELSVYAEQARRHGWIVSGSVNAKVEVLVVGPDASAQKVEAAKRRGLKIMSYEQWEDRLAEDGMPEAPPEEPHVPGRVRPPRRDLHELPCRDDYQSMAERDYGHEFAPLTSSQAITLHNWYMYAKAVVDRDHYRNRTEVKRLLARAAAVYISERTDLAGSVDSIMEARFRRHADKDFSKTVHRTEPFGEIADFVAAVAAQSALGRG